MDADTSTDRVARIQSAWRRERPDIDPSPQGIIGRLHRLANTLTQELVEVYARFDLNETEFDLLASLRRNGPPYTHPAGDLATHTMVTSGGLTKRVDRLIERGFVERVISDTDARQRLVRLTPRGFDVIDAAYTAHMENEHRLLELISPADREALEPILARWLRTLGTD